MSNSENPPENNTELPLMDQLDHEILMHREAHFAGNFDIMLDYYQKEGKGISADFTIDRILELAEMERAMKQNLAATLLSGPEAERVARAKEAYRGLRKLYDSASPKTKLPKLIADLILAEEEDPQAEIQAIEKEKEAIAPLLVDLLRSDDFHDPLFPGYGLAPILAARCLGKMGGKRAIISLFEALKQTDFFDSDTVITSLKNIGEPARDFLLKVVGSRPITEDNECAAIALIQFEDDPLVSSSCFKMLHDPEVREHPSLATYLVLACEKLEEPYHLEFIQLAKKKEIPANLKQDMNSVIAQWKK